MSQLLQYHYRLVGKDETNEDLAALWYRIESVPEMQKERRMDAEEEDQMVLEWRRVANELSLEVSEQV